jgi:hypothetical protein
MLELLGNNRKACIIGDNNKNSSYFQLGSGRAQGDNLSPNTFNFGNQILIFKIELDPRIKPIPRNIRQIIVSNDVFMQESNRETSKNESLADDNSTLMLIDDEGLDCIKDSLDRFASISGLECNYDKTMLMPFLDDWDDNTNLILQNSGFKIVDSVELLGIKISKRLDSANENFERSKQKIISKISFWDRFRLSLSGRIAIAKTFMVPQINYFGCIMKPDQHILTEIQNLIDNFVSKGLRISKTRMYLQPALGGIGMFNLAEFLDAQRFSWIVRAHKLPIDNWRYDLHQLSPGNNILLVRDCDINAAKNPILSCFVQSYNNILQHIIKKNIWEAEIFDSPLFKIPATNNTLNITFFGRERYERCRNNIRSLRLKECFNGNLVKSCVDFNPMGIPLTVDKWMLLAGAVNRWKLLANNFMEIYDPLFNITNLVQRIKKGSKCVRNMFLTTQNFSLSVRDLTSVNTYGALIDCEVPVAEKIPRWLKMWSENSLGSELKTFKYNCRFNCLPLNNRLNANRPEIDSRCTFCTFCRIKNNDTTQRDGFKHLFFSCPTTFDILQEVINLLQIDGVDIRPLYWFGINENNRAQSIWVLFFDVFRFAIYKFKLKKHVPNKNSFLAEFNFHLKRLCLVNKKIKNEFFAQLELARFLQAIG